MEATIISATREELVVEVTENINSTSEILRVSSFPVNTEFTDSFRLAPPVIDSFSPTSGGEVTFIRISGTGFHQQRDNNKILVGGMPLNSSNSSSTAVIFIIPPNIGLSTGDYKISVTTLGLATEAPVTFHFIAP